MYLVMISIFEIMNIFKKNFKKATVPQTLWCQFIYAFFTRQWIKILSELEYITEIEKSNTSDDSFFY